MPATGTVKPLLEESIEIDAPPATVWSLVSDLPRMSEWSPQVLRSFTRGPVRLGSLLLNVNRRGLLVWPTRSKVVRFEPHSEFAFRVLDNKTIWAFHLEPTASGTRVTQRRTTPQGTTAVSDKLVGAVMGGQESFQDELLAGMRQTLAKIKREAERAG
ncbi:SRPBCC family protein [Nocardioides alkalitolerans]|uniref:SRPBCC family protein n=1 Tax=Nocardioides alkalitolerans TaxID=281714 RepID=UPI000428A9F5|nr:SRPBCC family protein [Nocardioides alkalitolerans]